MPPYNPDNNNIGLPFLDFLASYNTGIVGILHLISTTK